MRYDVSNKNGKILSINFSQHMYVVQCFIYSLSSAFYFHISLILVLLNRPFPSSLVPLFQSESKCETILMKMTDLHENETACACRTHFHKKGFALRLVLKQRHKRTLKWPTNAELFIAFVKERS